MKHKADAMSGLIAATIASSTGRLARGHELTERQAQILQRSVKAAYNLRGMLLGDLSTWEYSLRESSYERLFTFAWMNGKLGADPAAYLAEVGEQLRQLGSGRALEPVATAEVHDLFAELANLVNGLFTSSGEGFTQFPTAGRSWTVHA